MIRNQGSVLVFVIITIAIMVGIVSVSTMKLANDAKRGMYLKTRLDSKIGFYDVVARCMNRVNVDTNSYDCYVEPWAEIVDVGEYEVRTTSENSRLNFGMVTEDELKYLIESLVGEENYELGYNTATQLYLQRELLKRESNQTNNVIKVVEELYYMKGVDANIVTLVLPHLTMTGDGQVNLNMASGNVFYAIFRSNGASIEEAKGLTEKILKVRDMGLFFESPSVEEGARVLLLSGEKLTAIEQQLLMKVMFKKFTTKSDFYSIEFCRKGGGVVGACVFEKKSNKMLQWWE